MQTELKKLVQSPAGFNDTLKITKYIDRNGAIGVNNGVITNGRHVRIAFLKEYMTKGIISIKRDLATAVLAEDISHAVKRMISIEKSTDYGDDVNGMKFFDDEMDIRYDIAKIKRIDSKYCQHALQGVKCIEDTLDLLNHRDYALGSLLFKSANGNLFQIDPNEARNFVLYGEPW